MRSARTSLRGLVVALLVAIAVLPSPASAATRQDRTESAILRAMNSVRARHGLPRLQASSALAKAADAHSAAMLRSGTFSHGAFNERLRRYTRARSVGETLAWMSRCDSGTVVSMWLQSAAHRRILLAPEFRVVGVGRKASAARCMVTADFASAR
jgi:uncharacterized protein YkwD